MISLACRETSEIGLITKTGFYAYRKASEIELLAKSMISLACRETTYRKASEIELLAKPMISLACHDAIEIGFQRTNYLDIGNYGDKKTLSLSTIVLHYKKEKN
ncbi:hypothetical protein J6590_058942 [Homalodisca vitripennis]|nr:hypothetical protein J6590_058942 [Homalodisca vitripennis]